MIVLLILLPLCLIFLMSYIGLLINAVIYNEINYLWLIICLFLVIISSYGVLCIFFKSFKDIPFVKNKEPYLHSSHNLICFSLLMFFGIMLIVLSCKSNFKVLELIVGIVAILLWGYALITFLCQMKREIVVVDCIVYENKMYELNCISDKYGLVNYYVSDDKYKKGDKLLCSFNKNMIIINKIIKKVDGK